MEGKKFLLMEAKAAQYQAVIIFQSVQKMIQQIGLSHAVVTGQEDSCRSAGQKVMVKLGQVMDFLLASDDVRRSAVVLHRGFFRPGIKKLPVE